VLSQAVEPLSEAYREAYRDLGHHLAMTGDHELMHVVQVIDRRST